MITFPKLLLILAIGVLVWVFLRKTKILGGPKAGGGGPQATTRRQAEGTIEDMVKCERCGAYVPAKGSHNCPGA